VISDTQALEPLVRGIPPVRSCRGRRRCKPGKLQADKGYDYAHLRKWLHGRGNTHRVARRGIESSQRLGHRCWTIERTLAWLDGCRHLHRRYECKADHCLALR
jgi:transposase